MSIPTSEIAQEFTALCQNGKMEEAGEKYWADNVVSLEPMDGEMARMEGKNAVKAKSDWWFGAHEVHRVDVGEPRINGDQFMVQFDMDVTNKESGERIQMQEEGLYTVADGKIVEERFFFGGLPQE
ncbi:MAG: nuclear transport factor 2 family protein [Sphingorhabdus sp.]